MWQLKVYRNLFKLRLCNLPRKLLQKNSVLKHLKLKSLDKFKNTMFKEILSRFKNKPNKLKKLENLCKQKKK